MPISLRVPSLRPVAVAAALLLAATATVSAQSRSADKRDDASRTSAPQAMLIEADGGSILFERSADELVYPASLAKMMTAEYVFNEIKQGRLKLDDEFTISEDAWRRGGAPSGGSAMFARLNSKVRVEDLLRSVVIQSGNDASIALAEGIAGNERRFAERMTQRARELGLTKSTFTNATGLPDPEQQVTMREMAHLARHIIHAYPNFYTMFAEREFTWNRIRQTNRNPLLALNIGADGLKTGYLRESGYGLVGSALQNGLRLIVAITGLKSANERANEARKLLEWGFRSFQSRMLFAEGQTIGEAKVYGGAKGRVPLVPAKPVRIMLPRNANDKIIARIVYTGPVPAPVREGQPIGRLKVWRNDALALEVPLQAGADVETGNLPQRAFDAATEMVISVFRAGADRL